MKLAIFALRDQAADAFGPPFARLNPAYAIREIADACRDPNHEFAKHAADYTLFQVGEFDQVSGQITVPEKGIVNLGNLLQYVPSETWHDPLSPVRADEAYQRGYEKTRKDGAK